MSRYKVVLLLPEFFNISGSVSNLKNFTLVNPGHLVQSIQLV
jgi:hypothetical protein